MGALERPLRPLFHERGQAASGSPLKVHTNHNFEHISVMDKSSISFLNQFLHKSKV